MLGSATVIDIQVFVDCTALKSVVLSKGVTAIDNNAFKNCAAITDVYYMGSESEWENITVGVYGNTTVTGATKHYNYVLQ